MTTFLEDLSEYIYRTTFLRDLFKHIYRIIFFEDLFKYNKMKIYLNIAT